MRSRREQSRAAICWPTPARRHQVPAPTSGRTRPQASKGTPVSLATARAEAARKLPVDRSKYQTIRSLDQLKAWIARAHETGQFAIEAKADSRSTRCRPKSAASRWRSAPNDACYIPLGHKQSGGGAGLFDAAAWRRTRSSRPSARRAAAAAGIGRHSQDRLQHQVQRRDVRAARHHPRATIDDAQLMSYALDAGRNSHGLDTLAESWLGHATIDSWRTDRQRQGQTHFRSGRDRQGDRIFGRGCRRDPAAVAGA